MTPYERLRQLALKCSKLARECPDQDLAAQLEELSVELAEEANNLQILLAASQPA